jgi:tetratricopeptide (TPR) repeat protein
MIQRHLLSYVKSNVDDLKETEDDIQTSASLAQVGQRILTALRNVSFHQILLISKTIHFYRNNSQKIGPTWLLNTLAALYWRGQGKTSNGIECFRQAISNVPDQYAHIPLTNLAALLLKMDQTQDALRLAALSYSFRRDEPNINFLLGILHLISGNYSHSVVHLQRTLKIQPDYPGAEHHRLLAACLYAEKEMGQKLQCNGVSQHFSS